VTYKGKSSVWPSVVIMVVAMWVTAPEAIGWPSMTSKAWGCAERSEREVVVAGKVFVNEGESCGPTVDQGRGSGSESHRGTASTSRRGGHRPYGSHRPGDRAEILIDKFEDKDFSQLPRTGPPGGSRHPLFPTGSPARLGHGFSTAAARRGTGNRSLQGGRFGQLKRTVGPLQHSTCRGYLQYGELALSVVNDGRGPTGPWQASERRSGAGGGGLGGGLRGPVWGRTRGKAPGARVAVRRRS